MLGYNASTIPIESLQVTASRRSSIEILWQIGKMQPTINVLGYRVHYQKVASSYIQYGPRLPLSDQTYNVQNLVPDTYYKICLSILRNDTYPNQKCVTASTESWDLPVSVGSSIGAILALSMIILLILMIRCRSVIVCKRKTKTKHSKYDAVSSPVHDDMYDFSQSETHPCEHVTNLSTSDIKPPVSVEKGHRDSASGAIPKRKPHRQNTFESQCSDHSDHMHVNGYIQSRIRHKSHDHYHDNSVILHTDGNNPDTTYVPEICSSNDHMTSISGINIRDKRQQMQHCRIPTFDNSIDSVTFPADKLDIIMSFPNADSSSESDCDIDEMGRINPENINKHCSEIRPNSHI